MPVPLETRATVVVQTAQGGLRGAVTAGGAAAFKGVPYAGDTSGPGRFRAPRAARSWSGVRDALAFGPICPQNDDDGVGAFAAFTQSEDCLNSNIWTPACDDRRRPVLVFFHGGGFTTGSGSLPLYDGERLATNQDIVVVTVNYRLGILGWPPFQAHGPAESNNLGLLDCLEALRWVQANIALFGGDPDNVCHAGQSAGAMISAMLTLLPQAKGLFHKAAPWSLQTLVALEPLRQAHYTAEVLEDLGLTDTRALLTAPLADLLKAQWTVRQKALHGLDTTDQIRWPFMPNHDGLLLTRDPALEVGDAPPDTPLFTGATTEELVVTPLQLNANPTAATLSTRPVTMAGLTKLFGADAAERVWITYAEAYPDATESELCGLIATDKDYRMPALRMAEANRSDSFVYAFAYRGRGPYFPNAHHALDLPFWFGTVEDPRFAGFFLGGEATAGELALAAAMQGALGRFLHGEGAGWNPYDAARTTMIFGLAPGSEHDPAAATRRVWDGLVP